jgi:hypothetical protein
MLGKYGSTGRVPSDRTSERRTGPQCTSFDQQPGNQQAVLGGYSLGQGQYVGIGVLSYRRPSDVNSLGAVSHDLVRKRDDALDGNVVE